MKKIALILLALTLVFGGCSKKADKPSETESTSKSDSVKKTDKTESKAATDAPTDGNVKNSSSDAVVGTDGKPVTGAQFEDMVNEANDPDTSEERKAELLKEIDYMLKQVDTDK